LGSLWRYKDPQAPAIKENKKPDASALTQDCSQASKINRLLYCFVAIMKRSIVVSEAPFKSNIEGLP
jgi:hypothetical protein